MALSRFSLADEFFDDMTVNIGEPKMSPLVLEGQSLVVDPQQMQNGCMKVVNMNAAGKNIVAEIIGFALAMTGVDAAAGHPHGETSRVMIATEIIALDLAL